MFRDHFDDYDGYSLTIKVRNTRHHRICTFSKSCKKKTKKRDTKIGTIDDNPEYRKFLESYDVDNEKNDIYSRDTRGNRSKNRELTAKKASPL